MNKHRLYTAGPTPIPPAGLLAMAQPIDYHRSERFCELMLEVESHLKYLCRTEADVAVIASSGTGAMECAIVNLFSPSDEVVVIRGGKFGERWAEMAAAFGLRTVSIDLEWGSSVDPSQIDAVLRDHPGTKAVLGTLCETSTGALHDIRGLGEVTRRHDVLLVCDAVSALGADDFRMDDWNVDALVSCSQKGLMTPPGLGLCAFGERALAAGESARLPRYYFDFRRYRKSLGKGQTPFTPAVSLLYGLHQALRQLREEGLDSVLERHARLATATREAVKALGLSVFAGCPANTVTSIRLPDGFDGKLLTSTLRDRHNVIFAGGQDHLMGRIIRIAHLGWMDDYDVIVAVSALERGLRECGLDVPLGSGVSAAQAVLGGQATEHSR